MRACAGLAATYAGLFGGGLAVAVRHGHELPERVDPADIALYGVATHRLSRLLSRERIARFVRAPFTSGTCGRRARRASPGPCSPRRSRAAPGRREQAREHGLPTGAGYRASPKAGSVVVSARSRAFGRSDSRTTAATTTIATAMSIAAAANAKW